MDNPSDPIPIYEPILRSNCTIQHHAGKRDGQCNAAIDHLHKALEHNPKYSAAWKLLEKSLAANDQLQEAIDAFDEGIEIAKSTGDIQASKEMTVFRKRVIKRLDQT